MAKQKISNQQAPVITIDGPSGSGKGAVSQQLAGQLKWHLLDSGSLYRVLALAAEQQHIYADDISALEQLAGNLAVHFQTKDIAVLPRIILDGIDVTDTIRTEECGNKASKIAAIPGVRLALLERQRAFCEAPGLVADGRDMGSVVFPEAFLKIYLEASPHERAKRRYQQLKVSGRSANLGRILAEIEERDRRDKERATAPLKAAHDALIIDTTNLSIVQVVDNIAQQAVARLT